MEETEDYIKYVDSVYKDMKRAAIPSIEEMEDFLKPTVGGTLKGKYGAKYIEPDSSPYWQFKAGEYEGLLEQMRDAYNELKEERDALLEQLESLNRGLGVHETGWDH